VRENPWFTVARGYSYLLSTALTGFCFYCAAIFFLVGLLRLGFVRWLVWCLATAGGTQPGNSTLNLQCGWRVRSLVAQTNGGKTIGEEKGKSLSALWRSGVPGDVRTCVLYVSRMRTRARARVRAPSSGRPGTSAATRPAAASAPRQHDDVTVLGIPSAHRRHGPKQPLTTARINKTTFFASLLWP